MCYHIFVLLYIPLHHPKERAVRQDGQQKSGLLGNNDISRPCNYHPCEILLEYHSLACRMVLYLMFNHYVH